MWRTVTAPTVTEDHLIDVQLRAGLWSSTPTTQSLRFLWIFSSIFDSSALFFLFFPKPLLLNHPTLGCHIRFVIHGGAAARLRSYLRSPHLLIPLLATAWQGLCLCFPTAALSFHPPSGRRQAAPVDQLNRALDPVEVKGGWFRRQ